MLLLLLNWLQLLLLTHRLKGLCLRIKSVGIGRSVVYARTSRRVTQQGITWCSRCSIIPNSSIALPKYHSLSNYRGSLQYAYCVVCSVL